MLGNAAAWVSVIPQISSSVSSTVTTAASTGTAVSEGQSFLSRLLPQATDYSSSGASAPRDWRALIFSSAGFLALAALALWAGKRRTPRRSNPPLGVVDPVTISLIVSGVAAGVSTIIGASKVAYDIRSGNRAERQEAYRQLVAQVNATQEGAREEAERQAYWAEIIRRTFIWGAGATALVGLFLIGRRSAA